ncbi:hypothetical protein R1sor_026324 [Riccia sorocarpa]|uniref:Uncharacterized protein n=1 Tax=Riccia sorocarpa TaxID=122646 RepID=A0ABD3GER2_9MARC
MLIVANRRLCSISRSATVWKVLLAVLGLVLIQAAAVACAATYSQKITTPTFSRDPCDFKNITCEWRRYANGANTVIINNYEYRDFYSSERTEMIREIRERKRSRTGTKTTILGTVEITLNDGYESLNPVNETRIKSEMDRWISFYKVDGIFFILPSPLNCASSKVMSNLVKYVRDHSKSPSGQRVTIADWSVYDSAQVEGLECYLKTTPSVDIFFTFIGNSANYEKYVPRPYMRKYSATRWYHVVGDEALGKLFSTVRKSKANHAGRVFVIDKKIEYYNYDVSEWTTKK